MAVPFSKRKTSVHGNRDGLTLFVKLFAANDVAGSPYLWTVPDIVPGTYQLQLLDDGVQSDVSLDFQIIAPALPPALGGNNGTTATPTTSVTALTSTATTTASDPGFTTTVYDEECGCQRTTTFAGEAEASAYAAASASAYASAGVGPAAAEASATAAASASASAGAEAGAGQTPAVGVGSGPASNYTAPLITPSLATYVANGASRVSGSAGVAAALFAVFLAAA